MKHRSFPSRSVEQLEQRVLLAGDLVGQLQLSEIVAANRDSLETRVVDSPGRRFRGPTMSPDWIELANRSDEDIDLTGRMLTDDPKHLARWPAGPYGDAARTSLCPPSAAFGPLFPLEESISGVGETSSGPADRRPGG